MNYKDFQKNTGSMLGNLARGAAKKVTKNPNVDKGFYDKIVKPAYDINRKAGKAVSDTPLLGGLFKGKSGDSLIAPLQKGKKLALPMLASAGLAHHVNQHKKKKKEKIENKIQENLQRGGQNMGQTKVAKLLKQSAEALKKEAGAKEEALEKLAELQAAEERRQKVWDKLIKMAQAEKISYDEIPEEAEKLASLEDKQFEIEMGVLEKVASGSYIDWGESSKKQNDYDNPLEEFVSKYSGY